MWQFAVGLYLVHLSNGQLLLAAVFGFSCGGTILLLGSLIGDWVDRNRRLTGILLIVHYNNKIRKYTHEELAG